MRRGEQAVDQLLVGQRVRVGDEGVDLLRRRRQADQVEREPADQGAAVGLRRRRQAFRLEPGQDERVDRVADPARVGAGQCPAQPAGGAAAATTSPGARRAAHRRRHRARRRRRRSMRGAGPPPRRSAARRGRHPLRRVGAGQALDERAVRTPPGTITGPESPPRSGQPSIQPEPAALLVGAVTRGTRTRKDRLDVPATRARGRGGWRSPDGSAAKARGSEQQKEEARHLVNDW